MSEAIQINLNDGYAEISYKESNGIKQNKIVDIDDIHSLFKENIDYDSGDLGIWGSNCIGIKRLISRGDKHWVLVEAVSPIVTVSFDGKEYKNVPFPSVLMGVKLVKDGIRYRVDKDRTFALCHENNLVLSSAQLYKFPFSNVFNEAMGKVCWGRIDLPKLDSFAQAIGVMQMFLQGDMNTDLLALSELEATGEYSKVVYDIKLDTRQKLGKTFNLLIKAGNYPYTDLKMREKTRYNDLIAYCKQNI
ncbi:MAG: hypothetical protein PHY47_00985 [Lachnospiraceae bacterium]|nr:hypothetical protein [Lachnospiraceae bacterium]